MLIYAAHESRTRVRFWTVERRLRRAIKDCLAVYAEEAALHPEEFTVLLRTGQQFLVSCAYGRAMSWIKI